jgi:hypothetical protein
LSRHIGFDLILHHSLELEKPELALPAGTYECVAVVNLSKSCVSMGLRDVHQIPHWNHRVPESPHQEEHQVIEGNAGTSEVDGHQNVQVHQWNRIRPHNRNKLRDVVECVRVDIQKICRHSVHDASHRSPIEELVDGCMQDCLHSVIIGLL